MSAPPESIPEQYLESASPNYADLESTIAKDDRFLDLFKIERVEYRDGHSKLKMVIEDRHLRTFGIAHGGVTATLLDSVMGSAAHSTAPENHYVVTVQLNLNYIRPAWNGSTMIAIGEVLHKGLQTCVTRGEIRREDDTLIASGTATFMYVKHTAKSKDNIPKHEDRKQ